MKNCYGALKDLDLSNNLSPNNFYTLKQRASAKYALNDYLGTLDDISRVNF